MWSTIVRYVVLFALGVVMSVNGVQAGENADIKDIIKKSFRVHGEGTVFLDLDHGNIEVVPRGGSEVLVEVELTVDAGNREDAKRILESYKPWFDQRGNDIHVKSRYAGEQDRWNRWRGHNRLKIRITVGVPERYNVEFTNGAGNVTVGDLDGNVRGRTGAGNLSLGAIRGEVRINSGTGNIEVQGAVGRIEASTGAGNILVRDVQGDLEVETGAGNIEAEITRQPRGDSHLSTGAGNVSVALGRRVGVQVDAVASVGSATTDFPLRIEGKWMRKSFSGDVNGGGPGLYMRAGVGNVELRKH